MRIIRSLLAGFVAILLVASVFGTAIGTGVSVEDDSLSEGRVAEDEVVEIKDWHDLDAVRKDLDGDYVLMNDLDENTAGYEERASETANTEDEFEEELGDFLGNDAGDRFKISYSPVEEILIARDTNDDSEVEVEIVDAEEGIIELQEDTDRYLYVEYKTSEEIGLGHEPIGDYDNRFTGTFDGNGNEIADLYINRLVETYVGLFGYSEGKVENIGVVDSHVSGQERVGGLVGQNYDGTVENSYATGDVNGENYIGGLVGGNSGVVSNSYAEGGVSGSSSVGGLAGYNWDTVENSYASGSVNGSWEVGGLAGGNHGTLSNSYATGDVSGDGGAVGGLVGRNWGTVENSYATGEVSGISRVGGLVGQNLRGTVENSHYNINEVLINGDHHVTIGGLFDEQYQDWIEDKNLDIADYSDTLVPSGDYYEVDSTDGLRDLLGFSGRDGYKFRLVSDIDLSGAPGLYIPYLAAEFDGQNHIISDLHISISASGVGMFGYVSSSGEVRNIGIVDAAVSGDSSVGGLVGYNYRGMVENSYTTGDVSGESSVGGLVGYQSRGIISNTSAAGVVNGNRSIGGLVGHDSGTVTNSYATADVEGEEYVGGLIGWNEIRSVKNSYSTGKVEGERNIGGLIGRHDGDLVENSYATGDVSGDSRVGGLVGYMAYSTVLNSFATGDVTGDSSVGGLVARESFRGGIENSFWDVETTGQDDSDGGTGKTTEEMKDVATFTDTDTEGLDEPWDFVGNPNDDEGLRNIWHIDQDEEINEGYPFLSWQDVDLDIYELKIRIEGEGSIDIDSQRTEIPYIGYYEGGEEVDLTAIPDEGWYFEGWTGDYEGTEEEITVTMDEDKVVTAHFQTDETYELTVNTVGEGSVGIEPDKEEYEYGEEVTLTAVPDEGHEFVEWEGTDKTGEEITITMDEDKDITAVFEEIEEEEEDEEDEEDDDWIPGFTSTLLLLGVIFAVAIYGKKKQL